MVDSELHGAVIALTDEVIDSAQSIVVQQAGNRMHVQKGIVMWLLGNMNKG